MFRILLRRGLAVSEITREEFERCYCGGLKEILSLGVSPTIDRGIIRGEMGLSFGQEEKYPYIKHWNSKEGV